MNQQRTAMQSLMRKREKRFTKILSRKKLAEINDLKNTVLIIKAFVASI